MAQLILQQTELTKPVVWSTTPGTTTAASTSYSIGFEVSVQELITITSVVWQTSSEATGLMAIWNASNGSLIASGKGAFSSPVPLLPGQTYVIGVEILQNANVSNVRQVGLAPYPFTWGQRRWNDGGPFQFPSHVGTEGAGFWAGDFTITAAYQDSETKTEPPEPIVAASPNQFVVTLPHEWMPLGIQEWDLQYSRSRDNAVFGNWIDVGTFPVTEIPGANEGDDPDVAGSYTHQALELANTTMFYRYRYRLRTSTQESDWSEIAYAGQVRSEVDTAVGPDSVGSDELQDGAVTSSKLGDLAVTSAKIDNLAVTNAKIGFAAVDTAQIRDLAVQRAKIALAAIDTAQINDAAINTAKIGDAQVTNAKIANLAAGNLQADLIQANNIATGAITSTLLSTDTAMANTVLSRLQQATSVVATGLSAVSASMGTLTSGVINGGRIIAGTAGGARVELGPNISTSGGTVTGIVGVDGGGAITFRIDTSGAAEFKGTVKAGSTGLGNFMDTLSPATQILDNTLPGPKIIADSITANEIAANSITSIELAALAVTAGKIAAGTVTATEIATGTITSTQLNATAIDSMIITLSGGGQMRSSSSATTNGLIFDNAGIRAYGSSINTLTISATDGSITANKGTFTGATFQTAAIGQRVMLDTLGLRYYDTSGTKTVDLSSASSGLQLTSTTMIDASGHYGWTSDRAVRWVSSINGNRTGYILGVTGTASFNSGENDMYVVAEPVTGGVVSKVMIVAGDMSDSSTYNSYIYISRSSQGASVGVGNITQGQKTLYDHTGFSSWVLTNSSANLASITANGSISASSIITSSGYMGSTADVRSGSFKIMNGGLNGTATGYVQDSFGFSIWTPNAAWIPNAWSLIAGTSSSGTSGSQGWLWYTQGVVGWSDAEGKRNIVELQEHVKTDQRSRVHDTVGIKDSAVHSPAATDSVLEKVRRLRGTHFEKRVDPDDKDSDYAPHIGFVAQEIQAEFPELVQYWEPTEQRSSGMYWLDAGHGMDAILLEAVKELADKVDNLENKLKEVKA